MGWTKNLKQVAAAKAIKPPPQPKPRPRLRREPPQAVTVQIRPSNGSDPGEVAIIHYVVSGQTLQLTDEMGAPLDGERTSAHFEDDGNLPALAKALARKRNGTDSFNRALSYQDFGLA